MTLGELKEALAAYGGDDLEIRVGISGQLHRIQAALVDDAARLLAVEYMEPGASDEAPYLLLQVSA